MKVHECSLNESHLAYPGAKDRQYGGIEEFFRAKLQGAATAPAETPKAADAVK